MGIKITIKHGYSRRFLACDFPASNPTPLGP